MTLGSWICLLVVWGIIIAVNLFCVIRVFRKREARPDRPQGHDDR
jgi:heme/copper-type cytochrome/quinol oxidase subunit 2